MTSLVCYHSQRIPSVLEMFMRYINLIFTYAVTDPEILKRGGDNVSASSSFSANAHGELYAFHTGKSVLLKKF